MDNPAYSALNVGQPKGFGKKDIFFTLITVVLFLVTVGGGYLAVSRMNSLESEKEQINDKYSNLLSEKEKLSRDNESLFLEIQDLESQLEDYKKKEEVAQIPPLNTQKRQIYEITLNNTWQDDSAVYTLKKVYLTDMLADIAESEDNDKSYVVFEVNVSDTRSSGSAQIVPLSGYLKLISEDKIFVSFISDYHFISPGESVSIYTGFSVGPDDKSFQFSISDKVPATVLNLDFSGDLANIIEGVIISKSGYFPEYSQNTVE